MIDARERDTKKKRIKSPPESKRIGGEKREKMRRERGRRKKRERASEKKRVCVCFEKRREEETRI